MNTTLEVGIARMTVFLNVMMCSFLHIYIGHIRPKRGRYSDPGSRGREHESTGEMLDSLIVRAGEKVCTILFFDTVQGSVVPRITGTGSKSVGAGTQPREIGRDHLQRAHRFQGQNTQKRLPMVRYVDLIWLASVLFPTGNACELTNGVWVCLILIHVCHFSY